MKTDPIFYRIFLVFPGIFFELIDKPPSLANAYQFSAVEVKQLSFRFDGVFLPKPEVDEPIYFIETIILYKFTQKSREEIEGKYKQSFGG